MKLNNKGFAITSIIYSMLILFLTLVLLILGNLASRKAVFDKQKNELLDKINIKTNEWLLTYDADGDTKVDFGDILTYNSESFYVMGIENSNIKLLSKYRVNLETKIQNPQHADKKDQAVEAFSSDMYWQTESDCLYSDGFNATDGCPRNTYIYDASKTNINGRTVIDYVAAYGVKLETMGAVADSSNNVRLMSFEEAEELGCVSVADGKNYYTCGPANSNLGNELEKYAPNWVWDTFYWLGSYGGFVDSYYRIWSVDSDGSFDRPMYHAIYEYEKVHGVRPVVVIPTSVVKYDLDNNLYS